jgi:hypothetical protein
MTLAAGALGYLLGYGLAAFARARFGCTALVPVRAWRPSQ